MEADKKTYLLTIKTGYFAMVALFAIVGVLCVGVTGIYFGSTRQAEKDREVIARTKVDLKDQQLSYEKRLGEQSARYALEANASVQALQQLQGVIEAIQLQNKKYALDRQDAMKRATLAATNAAKEARAASEKLTELTKQAKETTAAVAVATSAAVTAASAAKETQQTLDNATYPVAVPPPANKWGSKK